MSLKDQLMAAASQTSAGADIFDNFGVAENPFPSASQSSNNPHHRSRVDDEIDRRIISFTRDGRSQVVVIVGTQGVGKTNLLNFYEKELAEAGPTITGYYVIRYLADPEASFDGTLRHLFQELGSSHLQRLGNAIAVGELQHHIEEARSREMRTALQRLARTAQSASQEDVADAMLDWLLGLRLLNKHRNLLGVQFRLDTVESKTLALRDIIVVSRATGVLKGIFLLLDELEKQDGVLSPIYVVRYLSAVRAIIDALPNHLFMMMAMTPDALRRYSLALPAFQSRLQDQLELRPLESLGQALDLAHFYISEARARAEHQMDRGASGPVRPIVSDTTIRKIFEEQLNVAKRRGDVGLRQRDFLHALHLTAEDAIQGA